MYIKKYIQFFGILSALLFTTACGEEDIPSGGEGGGTGDGGSSTPVRTITTHINEFQVEGENSSLPGEGEIKELQVWGIERSGFFNGREKWAKGFENQRV